MFVILLLLSLWVPSTESHTYFVGDSIGWIANDYGFLDYDHIDAEPGRKMEAGLEVVQALDLQAGDRLIMELGTNNLDNISSWHLVQDILSVVPPGVRVTWIAPTGLYIPEAGAAFLQLLNEVDRPDFDIMPWSLIATPSMLYDTVHPTYAGSFLFAALLEPNMQLWL